MSESSDARLNAIMRELAERFPLTWDSPSRVIDVLRTGEPELVTVMTDEWIEAHVETNAQLELARSVDVRSVMIVPLVARETVIGTMSLTAVGNRRPYDAVDLQVARELAGRAAFAIENARLYTDAQLATRARDEVLGVVSHDLRNPLSAIAMCTNTLLANVQSDNASQRELLTTVYQSTQWMNRLIQDLLDVANIEAGRLSVERRSEPVEPILERALSMFERQAREKSVALRVAIRDVVPDVFVDAERIVQVLTNLVGNAMKFTDAGGSITLEAAQQESEVAITVSDTGAGIPPEHLPHVFERYWQARRTARKRGSGLGLAIARGIVEAHGGRIEAWSTLGQGSTFRFTVPLVTSDVRSTLIR
jgi:signal transduction histidine kinase